MLQMESPLLAAGILWLLLSKCMNSLKSGSDDALARQEIFCWCYRLARPLMTAIKPAALNIA